MYLVLEYILLVFGASATGSGCIPTNWTLCIPSSVKIGYAYVVCISTCHRFSWVSLQKSWRNCDFWMEIEYRTLMITLSPGTRSGRLSFLRQFVLSFNKIANVILRTLFYFRTVKLWFRGEQNFSNFNLMLLEMVENVNECDFSCDRDVSMYIGEKVRQRLDIF